jgi:hypothetical protein
MQQHRQLSGCRNDGSLLPIGSTSLRQLQAPTPQVAIDPEWSQDVVRSLHQQRSQIRVAFLANMHLRLALSGVSPPRLQP